MCPCITPQVAGAMHTDLYAYVVRCFQYLELMSLASTSHSDCLMVDEDPVIINLAFVYVLENWTFDTCSPLRLRFSQRGDHTPIWQISTPIWKCLDVDLLDEDLELTEDPDYFTVEFTLPTPVYRVFSLRSCVIDNSVHGATSIALCSEYHYSETRKNIIEGSTKLPSALVCMCESFFFCPGSWRVTRTVYILPNPPSDAGERNDYAVPCEFDSDDDFECPISCEHCGQYCTPSGMEGDPPKEPDAMP